MYTYQGASRAIRTPKNLKLRRSIQSHNTWFRTDTQSNYEVTSMRTPAGNSVAVSIV